MVEAGEMGLRLDLRTDCCQCHSTGQLLRGVLLYTESIKIAHRTPRLIIRLDLLRHCSRTAHPPPRRRSAQAPDVTRRKLRPLRLDTFENPHHTLGRLVASPRRVVSRRHRISEAATRDPPRLVSVQGVLLRILLHHRGHGHLVVFVLSDRPEIPRA